MEIPKNIEEIFKNLREFKGNSIFYGDSLKLALLLKNEWGLKSAKYPSEEAEKEDFINYNRAMLWKKYIATLIESFYREFNHLGEMRQSDRDNGYILANWLLRQGSDYIPPVIAHAEFDFQLNNK